MYRKFLVLFLLLCLWRSANAQQDAYKQYIETYKSMAIDQMQRYRIPASITLAQGILESNAGRSSLATIANNHFGIKTGGTWNGPFVLRNDDAPNEQFRKYNTAEESFEDHSLFLTARGRYSSLFFLEPSDYRGWAHGLKAAGYATNPRYADLLISLIERYELSKYDLAHSNKSTRLTRLAEADGRRLYLCNDIVYVVARQGDTFATLAHELEMSEKKLRKYNEADKNYSLMQGDVVYLAKKKKHVARPIRLTLHTVAEGESMYAIAQRYGIRLEKLYAWNLLRPDHTLAVGEQLLLR